MSEITVIMPVYNGAQFLSESIESVLNQTFTDFTLLILNDNSTDNTPKILDDYKQKDSRIQVITKSVNVGPANLRNEGIEKASTEFIALLDADDIALPNRFEKQIKLLKENPEIGVCGTWFTFFGDKKNKLVKHAVTHDELKVQFLKSCGIGNPTVMFRKSVLGYLKFEHKYVPAEDYGLWSQLIAKTQFYNIPESLLMYRWHPNNISQTKVANLNKSNILIRAKQLENLGIHGGDKNLEYYVNAVSLKRQLSKKDIKKTLKASKKLKKLNQNSNYFKQHIFERHLNTIAVRTIRNAKNYDMSFYKFIKKESGFFNQLPLVDKVLLFFKCLF